MNNARRLLCVVALALGAAAVPAGIASAQQNPTTGQPGTSATPSVNCGTATGPVEPGHASSAPGSPFNEPAPVGKGSGGTAGGNYAGSGPSLTHAGSTAAVSQYDAACGRLSPH